MPTPAPAPPQRIENPELSRGSEGPELTEGQPTPVVAPIATTPVADLLRLPPDTSGYWLGHWLSWQQLRTPAISKIKGKSI